MSGPLVDGTEWGVRLIISWATGVVTIQIFIPNPHSRERTQWGTEAVKTPENDPNLVTWYGPDDPEKSVFSLSTHSFNLILSSCAVQSSQLVDAEKSVRHWRTVLHDVLSLYRV